MNGTRVQNPSFAINGDGSAIIRNVCGISNKAGEDNRNNETKRECKTLGESHGCREGREKARVKRMIRVFSYIYENIAPEFPR